MLHPNNGDFPVRSYSSPCEAPCEAASEPTEKHSPWNTVTSWAPQLVPDFLMQCWHNNGRYRYLLHIYIYYYYRYFYYYSIMIISIIIIMIVIITIIIYILYICMYIHESNNCKYHSTYQTYRSWQGGCHYIIYIWVWHMRYDINIWYMIYDVWYMICIYAIKNMYIVGFPNLRHNPPFIAPAWWWEPSWSLATSHSWNTSRHHGRNFGVIFLKRCSSVAFLP